MKDKSDNGKIDTARLSLVTIVYRVNLVEED